MTNYRCAGYRLLLVFCIFLHCSGEQYRFLSFDKIDAHVHLRYAGPEFLEQAAADNFKVLAIIHDRYDLDWQQEFIDQQRVNRSQQLAFLTSFSMNGWNEPEWQERTIQRLQRSFTDGALGVKIWKNVGIEFQDENGNYILIDNPRFDRIFDFIESQNRPLAAHIGEPVDAWRPIARMRARSSRDYYTQNPEYHMYHRHNTPGHAELVASYQRMLEKHPNIRYIACHLGSLESNLAELAQILDRFPNMAVDTAARIDDLQLLEREEVRSFFIRYQDRILYGTDLSIREEHDPHDYARHAHKTWQLDWAYFASDSVLTIPGVDNPVQGLQLPVPVLRKIYWSNAHKWYQGI